MDIINELQIVFRDVFDDDSIVITKDMCAKDIVGWDSLAQIRLVVAIERRFKILVDNTEESKKIYLMDSVAEIAEWIGQRIDYTESNI